MRQTLKRREILRKEKDIRDLLTNGKKIHGNSFVLYILKISEISDTIPVRVYFQVRKKNIKKASDRNRLKRILREIYRKNKLFFYKYYENSQLFIGFIYKKSEILPYKTIEDDFQNILKNNFTHSKN